MSGSQCYGQQADLRDKTRQEDGSERSLAQAALDTPQHMPPTSLVHRVLLLPSLATFIQPMSGGILLCRCVPEFSILGKLQPIFFPPVTAVEDDAEQCSLRLGRCPQGTMGRRNIRKSACLISGFSQPERSWESVPSLFLQQGVVLGPLTNQQEAVCMTSSTVPRAPCPPLRPRTLSPALCLHGLWLHFLRQG